MCDKSKSKSESKSANGMYGCYGVRTCGCCFVPQCA